MADVSNPNAALAVASDLVRKAASVMSSASVALERIVEARDAVSTMLSSLGVTHRWIGTRLDIMGADGEYVEGPNLRGASGSNGWSPIEASAIDGERRLRKVVDWVGGQGSKPPVDVYLSQGGYTSYIEEATDFRGAHGLTPDTSVLSTTTLAPGQPATVTLDPSSTPEEPKLVFGVPKGDTGETPDITILPTTTLAPGEPAEVTLDPSGTPEAPKMAFSIPAGVQGLPGAPGEPLVLVVSDTTDIGLGGWWVARDYHGAATCDYLRAEMLVGEADGVTLAVRKNGATVRSGIALGAGVTTITDLGLVLAEGDQVSVHREGGGTLAGPWVMMVQIDGRAP